MSNAKKILFAGDSPAGGPANYLLAILKKNNYEVLHIPPGIALQDSDLAFNPDAIILSDYGSDSISTVLQNQIVQKVENGCGLLMVGGWGSFSGPFGQWAHTPIADVLPVQCSDQDDRLNYASGLVVERADSHTIIDLLDFSTPPILCGLNQLGLKENSKVLLSARKLLQNHDGNSIGLSLDEEKLPLLVISNSEEIRTAAFATDFAPHWCGGLVDWGTEHKKLNVQDDIFVEIGNTYIQFVSNILSWITR